MTDTKLALMGILLTIALSGSLLTWIGYHKWRMHQSKQPRATFDLEEERSLPLKAVLDWPTWSVHSRPFDQEWD
jgi:hypothetical protein